jgi:putative sigma-54 modulation protein
MELTFTGRDLHVTSRMRETAGHKLARLERMEPRTVRIDLEFIAEHYPTLDGVKRIEAALHIPRKTFRAHAEADDVPTALDRVADKLERQLRDHHGKRRASLHRAGLESAPPSPTAADREEGPDDLIEGDA